MALRSSFAAIAFTMLLALFAEAQQPGGDFRMRSVISPRGVQTFRWHIKTGDSWKLENDTWVRIGESDKQPAAGDFDLVLASSPDSWMAYRIDTLSGTSWAAFPGAKPRELTWKLLKEAAPAAVVAPTTAPQLAPAPVPAPVPAP